MNPVTRHEMMMYRTVDMERARAIKKSKTQRGKELMCLDGKQHMAS